MTVLESIKSLMSFQPAPLALKAAPSIPDIFGPDGRRNADWSSISDMPRVADAYRKCATAYACVTLLADAVAESPLRVYRTIDGELEEQPDHRCRVLLANPNPYMSEAEFFSLVVMTQGMFGYSLVEKVRSGAGLPVQLWPLRPDWMTRDKSRWVYRVPRFDPRYIDDDDLIIVPYRHDERQASLGITPLQIIAREIGIDVALTDLLKVFIDAGGIPPWVVKLADDVTMNQTEADTFREKWGQRYGGSQAYQNIGILNPGMDLVKVGDSIGDMAWPDLRGLTEMKIAQAFRVPADLVQARDSMKSGSLTTTEMTGAMAFLQNHGAQPLRMRIDGAFTRGLLADFTGGDSSLSLEFDTSGILALQEDQDDRSTRILAEFSGRVIMLNEARTALGYRDLGPAGDVFPVLFNMTYLRPEELANTNANAPLFAPVVREGQIQAEAEAAATNGSMEELAGKIALARFRELPARAIEFMPRQFIHPRVYRDHKAMSEIETKARANILQTTRRDRDKLTQIADRKLRVFFREQGKRVVAAFPKSAGNIEITVYSWMGYDYKETLAGINWDHEDDLLRELMDKFYASVGERAFGTAAATLDVVIAWDLGNPNIVNVLDQLGLRITEISETTRQDVIRWITDGQSQGLNLTQISDNITGLFTETYSHRALTIARTETQVSWNLASQLGYQESGVVDNVELIDNPDHDADPMPPTDTTCADRSGLVVGVNEIDQYVESAHPNCVLAVIPILATPLGEV